MTIDSDSLPKGAGRLLWDCSTLGRMLDAEGPTAAERLAAAIKDHGVLIAALAASLPEAPASAFDAA